MAYDAVTIGWRVWWLVAAVAMFSVVETAPTAPDSVAASLTLKRSEMNTQPRPSRSASATSVIRSRGDWRRAGECVEAEVLERHGRRLAHRAWDDRLVSDVLDPRSSTSIGVLLTPTGLDGSAGAGGETGEEFRAAEVARFEQLGRR